MTGFLIIIFTACSLISVRLIVARKPLRMNKEQFVVSLITLSILLVGWIYAVILKIVSSEYAQFFK